MCEKCALDGDDFFAAPCLDEVRDSLTGERRVGEAGQLSLPLLSSMTDLVVNSTLGAIPGKEEDLFISISLSAAPSLEVIPGLGYRKSLLLSSTVAKISPSGGTN